jgi:hypothetical protein
MPTATFQASAVGDHVEHDVAAGAAHLVLRDDPVEPQRHAEFARERLTELDLEPRRIAGLVREGQRARVCTQPDAAELADGGERARLGPPGQRKDGTGHQEENFLHWMLPDAHRVPLNAASSRGYR